MLVLVINRPGSGPVMMLRMSATPFETTSALPENGDLTRRMVFIGVVYFYWEFILMLMGALFNIKKMFIELIMEDVCSLL